MTGDVPGRLASALLIVSCLALVAACGGSSLPSAGQTQQAPDTGVPATPGGDDAGATPTPEVVDEPQHVDPAHDDFGDPCSSPDDCDSGWCVLGPQGSACFREAAGDCTHCPECTPSNSTAPTAAWIVV